MNTRRKTGTYEAAWRNARILAVGALATVAMAHGGAALATGDRSTAISGNSTFSDCGAPGSDLALMMTGDLQGCLSVFIQDYSCRELRDFDHYQEYGREAFAGTWRGKRGRFTTDYVVDAAYAKGFCQSLDYSLEVSGSCIHHVRGRSGAFAGAEGVFTLFDVITGVTGDPVTGEFVAGSGANNFLYYGRIRKHGWRDQAPAALDELVPAAPRSSLAAVAAARKAQSRRSC